MIPLPRRYILNTLANGYQPVLGSLRFKLLFCILLYLNSRYLKQNLQVVAIFLLTSDLRCPVLPMAETTIVNNGAL